LLFVKVENLKNKQLWILADKLPVLSFCFISLVQSLLNILPQFLLKMCHAFLFSFASRANINNSHQTENLDEFYFKA